MNMMCQKFSIANQMNITDPTFWRDAKGNHPSPFMQITKE